MVPEAALAMLACARIGAPHIVVFAGFSDQVRRERKRDRESRSMRGKEGGT
jgi:acetyl-CoA synthetase